ncbi:uncharacterized protein F5147DRAFT_647727 [Suillus discolor]|uniref:Uncharacterized protein n=1 Tax=Suillus discolor TaxID=1912936 RepID=A0A9P7FL04_9AGAM|nr:uncharacterized protein F5147DRAFT_647727 [Suillus discolor]KAG2119859.1 hypothetical protein F5147DRAFT_647727 [Suillus discolor]
MALQKLCVVSTVTSAVFPFTVNLNEMCHITHRISTYEDWSHTSFELQRLSSPLCYAEIAPYFTDYLGAHWSIYPPQTRSCTVSAIPSHSNNNRRHHSAVFPTARDQLLGCVHHPVQHQMQHVKPDALIAPPKHAPDLPMVEKGPILSPNEPGHLYELAAGRGIDVFDADGLLEKCDSCQPKRTREREKFWREESLEGCERKGSMWMGEGMR